MIFLTKPILYMLLFWLIAGSAQAQVTDADGDFLLDSEETYLAENEGFRAHIFSVSGGDGALLSSTNPHSFHPNLTDYAWLALHYQAGTFAPSILHNDSDGDGIPDWIEAQYSEMNALDPDDGIGDLDNNGVLNFVQFELGMALDAEASGVIDADNDGISDAYEVAVGLNPLRYEDAVEDSDNDGLFNFEERLNGSSPIRDYSFGNHGILNELWYTTSVGNSAEFNIFREQPQLASDYAVYFGLEVSWKSIEEWPFVEPVPEHPIRIENLSELGEKDRPDYQPIVVLNPISANDWDGDGLSNSIEYRMLRNHKDGPRSWLEISLALRNPDMDGDGIPDGLEDWDGDGLSNLDEISLGTLPWLADSDSDTVNDKEDPAPMDPSTNTLLISITAPIRGGVVE